MNFRSSFLENLESGGIPASAARICSPRSRSTTTTRTASTRSSTDLDKVTAARGAAGGEEVSGAGEPHVDRSPARREVRSDRSCRVRLRFIGFWRAVCRSVVVAPAFAQASAPGTARGRTGAAVPARASRREDAARTGCASSSRGRRRSRRSSITLTVLSGYSSDPADLTGLAALTADVIQEGTKTKSSRQIRRDVFGMGGSLSAAVVAGLLLDHGARPVGVRAAAHRSRSPTSAMNPTMPEDEVAILKQQHLQTVSQQKASPQFLANRDVPRGAVRRASLRAHERDRSVAQGDGPREARGVSPRPLPARTTRSC